jgi:diadenylate cyclase
MQFFATITDTLIVAVLIYAVIQLFKRTQSIFIFRGIVTLLVIYLLAYHFGLRLTVTIFQFFFSFFIVILVVVFQKEFRRFFEGFSFSLVRKLFFDKKAPEFEQVMQAVLTSVDYFAKNKVGALIVLPGHGHVDRHIEGGYKLDGKVSVPLLMSIFETSTPGHDGALIIERDRISRFGVHLPLAENVRAVSDRGTRHRAGLGLAERTDALVIIVSEERGTISVAHNSKIEQVSEVELQSRMEAFSDEMYKKSGKNMWYEVLTYNFQDRLVAVAIAIILWLSIVGKV